MRIVIVGDGKVGLTLTQMLSAEDHDVTVVDSDNKVLERLLDEYDVMAVHGHGASRQVLEEAGAGEADLLIAATSSDEVNLLSCLLAKKMGCANTIARVRSTTYAEDIELLREELGLSFAINPEETCAREIFRILQIPSFISREPFTQGQVEIVNFKVAAASPLSGLALYNLPDTVRVKVLLCAVLRGGEIHIPKGDFVLSEGDEVFAAAASADLAALIKSLGLGTRKVTQVSIVGGSLLGFYLAQMLLEAGVGVKIIERDEERCLALSEQLPEADVVHGDGTEREVLLSEGVDRGDALVSLTGIDEENIILSMFARQLGLGITITKCSRNQYGEMFGDMGLDSVVSPKMNCAEEIVRYVRAMENSVGGQMLTMHHLAHGKAEALEFRADETSEGVTGLALRDLKLKKGVLIASITRGRYTIIPSGADLIRPGDNVVVVSASGHRILELTDILAD